MKNRILCRLMSLGTAVLIAAGALFPKAPYHWEATAYGASLENEASGVEIAERAYWTDEENFRAELTVEITGLKEWMETHEKNEPNENTEPVENKEPDENAEPVENKEPNENAEPNENTEPVENTEQNEKNESDDQNGQIYEKEQDETGGQNVNPAENLQGTDEVLFITPAGESVDENARMDETAEDSAAFTEAYPEEVGETVSNAVSAGLRSAYMGNGMIKAGYSITENRDEGDLQAVLTMGISRYFQVVEEELPKGGILQELTLTGQDGQNETVTEVTCPISLSDLEETTVAIRVPLLCREEYRYNENSRILPVHYLPSANQTGQTDSGMDGFQAGAGEAATDADTADSATDAVNTAGTILAAVQNGRTWILAENSGEVNLEAAATPADYTLSVETDTETPKAGQLLNYQVTVTNTGRQPLPLISMESSLNPAELNGTWLTSDAEQETDISGRKVILTNLKTEETRHLTYQVKLPESLTEQVVNTITASARKTSETRNMVVRGVSLKTKVTPLKIDFTVNKFADRTTAAPGDTITYQICIRNTGERTLHSVISTERFQTENIHAYFVKKDGVILNSDKTQALISEIPPGEVFSLEAVVTLPEKLESDELINQVFVRTQETGDKILEASAGVKVQEFSPTAAPPDTSPVPQNNEDMLTGAQAVSDAPKTSDDSHPLFWVLLLCLALTAAGSALWRRRFCGERKRKH